jgi:hypothetical protein
MTVFFLALMGTISIVLIVFGVSGIYSFMKKNKRWIARHLKTFYSIFASVYFIVFVIIIVRSVYNYNLNILHNEYARQDSIVYNTAFHYTEYYPVTGPTIIAVIYFILSLFLLYCIIIKHRQKNLES